MWWLRGREGKLVGGGELLEEGSGVVKEEEEEFDEELERRKIVGFVVFSPFY